MLTTALLLMLSAAPVKIAASGFVVTGENPARANVWLERFAEVMRRNKGIEVTTSDDIAQLLGIERQRQLLGCASDGSSCIAELADALGAGGVLVGTFTKSDDSYLVVLRVVRQPSGAIWWSASSRVKGETALLDWLDEQASACANALIPSTPGSTGPYVVGGVGAVVLVTGASLLVVANTVGLRAAQEAGTEQSLSSALSTGRAESTSGVVLLAVGAAAITGAILWKVLDRPAAPVALAPIPGGGLVTFGGQW
jgi:hypothetical protein